LLPIEDNLHVDLGVGELISSRLLLGRALRRRRYAPKVLNQIEEELWLASNLPRLGVVQLQLFKHLLNYTVSKH